jgi:hypothetical protein
MNSNSVVCDTCFGYLPGHASGAGDLCSCEPIAEFRPLWGKGRACDSVLAWRLGEAAAEAGSPCRNDIGDPIDRGLILLRLLSERGFIVYAKRP